MFVNILYFKRVIYIFVFDKGRKIRVTNTDTVTSLSNRFSCIYIILTERYLCLEARACKRGVTYISRYAGSENGNYDIFDDSVGSRRSKCAYFISLVSLILCTIVFVIL